MLDYKYIVENIKTPTYVFDINKLDERVNYLKNKLDNKFALVYAVKANSFISKEIENEVERFEICSPGEFDICNGLGIDRSKMVISGVYKDRETIENMLANYSDIGKYTIESVNQYELLKELTKKYSRKINILIRLTSGNQFGVTSDELKNIISDKDELINVSGIEYFSGTQKTSIKKINREVDNLIELVNDIEENLGFKIEEIEYGPGVPVFYFQDDVFDEEEYFNELNNALLRLGNKKILLEIGRGIAASCGTYFTKVVDLKTNKNGNHVILDGGMNHLVYYGQTMAMRIPHYEIYPKKDKKEKEIYNLYGSLCTINDIIVKNIEIEKLELGDVFVFKNVGAYSVTEGISLFLSRDLPKVVLYTRNKEFKVVRDVVKTSKINYPNY